MLLGATLVASAGSVASPFPSFKGKSDNPLGRMKKANTTQRWADVKTASQKQRVAPFFSTPTVDEFQYLSGPDGTQWFATCNYDYEDVILEGGYATEHLIKGFTYTVYDNKFNEIGSVSDIINLQEGETRCAAVMLDVTVTKRFFKSDEKYEVMVSFAMNTPEYVTNTRTNIYAIEKLAEGETSTPLMTLPGYPVDAIDCAADKWSEDFYITFYEEQRPDPDMDFPNYIDFLAEYKSVLTTYSKGGYNSEPKVVFEKVIPNLNLPGDQMSSPMMLCKKIDGKLALIYVQYEKSFFIDPSGMSGNEDITPDNNLIVEVYKMNDSYPSEIELINTTTIKTVPNTEDPNVYYTFYGVGALSWDKDVDYDGHYTADGRPAFVVTVDEYLLNDDDHYNSSYYVYDADGNRIKTIAKDTYDYVKMTDIPGYEPQTMFVHMGDAMNFEFVDLYSCNTVTEVDQQYRGYGLSTSIDRVATAGGYCYASALSSGIPMDDTSLYAPVCWLDSNGDMIRLDKIPTGKNVELAQIYISSGALSPYIFNTDKDLEYMLLVKRGSENSTVLQEELLIATPENGVIHSFTPDSKKGDIRMVYLTEGADPELIIVYLNNNKFTADAYALPFTKFAGGTGTEEDPYLIASAGDIQQIKSDPAGNYKITADIDCGGVTFSQINQFTGVLDGDNHTISNLSIYSDDKAALFRYCINATVKNIRFDNTSMLLYGDYDAAVIASEASRSNFENIHINGVSVSGDNFGGLFGTIAAKSYTYTNFMACEVTDADIDLPSCSGAGGIVGDIRTSTAITGCAFSGNLTAKNTLGGIVGTTTTGDEVISQCHVDANLKAENTVGGIAGFLDRSIVKSNYVEGTIEATKASKWTNALSLGGIAGEMEGDWQKTGDSPITNNMIGVSAFIYPTLEVEEKYPHQLATVHRVVGRTSYNAEPEYDEDADGNPIYKGEVKYETGVSNNLVVSGLAVIDNDFAEKTIEGTTYNKEDVTADMLAEKLGFAFGSTPDAPWTFDSESPSDPYLYYEKSESGVETVSSVANKIILSSDMILAQGCEIKIFDLAGNLLLSANDGVSIASLDSGVFVATAKDSKGMTSTIKFVK